MEDQITSIRLSAIETRLAAIEGRLTAIEQSSAAKPKRKKELTLEERQAIRTRLLAGQQAKKERELAEATAKNAEQPKANKKKEAKNEG